MSRSTSKKGAKKATTRGEDDAAPGAAGEASPAESAGGAAAASSVEGTPSSPTPRAGDTPYRDALPGKRAHVKATTIWQRATYRWTAITVVMAALLILYTYHPYYRNQQFTPFKTIYPPAFVLWLVFGLFYVKATLEKFSERRFTMRDSGLHLVALGKAAFEDVLSHAQWYAVALFASGAAALGAGRALTAKTSAFHSGYASAGIYACGFIALLFVVRCLRPKRIWRLVRNRRVRTTLLAICVKAFFTPLMTGFVVNHLNGISRAWLKHKDLPPMDFKVPTDGGIGAAVSMWWSHVGVRIGDLVPSLQDLAGFVQPWTWTRADVSWGLGVSYDVIFAIDCGWALFGYASESRWLGNKTRSVEPTAFGWLVCLACYPPFNNVLGTYLPLENGPQLITSEVGRLALRGAVVFLFAIYAAATVSFGFKFSNLTNRGIVSRGPYRFVRHPAYLCKCAAWWLEHVPTMTLTKAFFLTLLCGVYALRAWTEERHLGADPEYREYKKKTPWVLFPGVY